MSGAAHHRGKSRQDYETPLSFLHAFETRFGPIGVDLAATEKNTKAHLFITPEEDSLSANWSTLSQWGWAVWLFLNPPFGNIAPWAEKCSLESCRGCRIALLVPASVGANWYRDFVHDKARVFFLNGRISFDGKNPFPRDCLLALYGETPGYEVWTWKERAVKPADERQLQLFGACD